MEPTIYEYSALSLIIFVGMILTYSGIWLHETSIGAIEKTTIMLRHYTNLLRASNGEITFIQDKYTSQFRSAGLFLCAGISVIVEIVGFYLFVIGTTTLLFL